MKNQIEINKIATLDIKISNKVCTYKIKINEIKNNVINFYFHDVVSPQFVVEIIEWVDKSIKIPILIDKKYKLNECVVRDSKLMDTRNSIEPFALSIEYKNMEIY